MRGLDGRDNRRPGEAVGVHRAVGRSSARGNDGNRQSLRNLAPHRKNGARSEERRVGKKVTGVQTCALPIFSLAGADVVIEGGAVVDPSATLHRCVVWTGATIGARARLSECIVLSGAQVPAGTTATDKVFGI